MLKYSVYLTDTEFGRFRDFSGIIQEEILSFSPGGLPFKGGSFAKIDSIISRLRPAVSFGE